MMSLTAVEFKSHVVILGIYVQKSREKDSTTESDYS